MRRQPRVVVRFPLGLTLGVVTALVSVCLLREANDGHASFFPCTGRCLPC
jgi:hypothetical protein